MNAPQIWHTFGPNVCHKWHTFSPTITPNHAQSRPITPNHGIRQIIDSDKPNVAKLCLHTECCSERLHLNVSKYDQHGVCGMDHNWKSKTLKGPFWATQMCAFQLRTGPTCLKIILRPSRLAGMTGSKPIKKKQGNYIPVGCTNSGGQGLPRISVEDDAWHLSCAGGGGGNCRLFII